MKPALWLVFFLLVGLDLAAQFKKDQLFDIRWIVDRNETIFCTLTMTPIKPSDRV